MNFADAVKTCFRKYADFTGRAARSEFWWFELFIIIAQAICGVLYRPLGTAFSLAVLVPAFAVAARRLHDTDRSGWWLLLWLAPLIGWIVLLIWYCQRGTAGSNRFGPPPLAADALEAET